MTLQAQSFLSRGPEGYLQHSFGINRYQLKRWFDAAWTPVGGRLSVNPDYKKFRASICELEYSHVQIFGKPKLGTGGSGDRNRTSNTVRAHLLPRFKVQTIISRLRALKHAFRFVSNLSVQSRLFPFIRALSAMRTAPGVTSAEIIMRNSRVQACLSISFECKSMCAFGPVCFRSFVH